MTEQSMGHIVKVKIWSGESQILSRLNPSFLTNITEILHLAPAPAPTAKPRGHDSP